MERDFAATDKGKAHDQWFRAKVETALASQAPIAPHDQVIGEMNAIIEARRNAGSRGRRK